MLACALYLRMLEIGNRYPFVFANLALTMGDDEQIALPGLDGRHSRADLMANTVAYAMVAAGHKHGLDGMLSAVSPQE